MTLESILNLSIQKFNQDSHSSSISCHVRFS